MVKLSVIVYVHGDSNACLMAKDVARQYVLTDTDITVSDSSVNLEELDYKHLGILITEDDKDMDLGDNEFLHTVYLGDDVPDVRGRIQAIVNPDEKELLFKHQVRYVIDSLINEYRLELTWNMLDTVINSTPDMVWYKAINGDHFNVNNSFCKVVTKTKDDIEGRKHAYIWGVTEDEAYACQESEEKTLAAGKTCTFEELVNTPYGMRTMVTYKTPLKTARGTVIATAGIAQDVTKQREYEQQLHMMATTDPLSGLYNRRYLYQVGDSQYVGQKTIVYIDIDYFKHINDTYGHDKGDAILRLVSKELQFKFQHEIVARMGGDEFVILSRNELSDDELKERFDNMQEAFDMSRDAEGIKVQLSVGVYRGDAAMEEAITLADELMYENKRMHHEQAGKE